MSAEAAAVGHALLVTQGIPNGREKIPGLESIGIQLGQSPVEAHNFARLDFEDEAVESLRLGLRKRAGPWRLIGMRVPAGGKISVQVNAVGIVPGTCLEAVRVPAWNDHGGAFCGNLRELFGYKPLQETDGGGFITMSASQEEGPWARICLGADFWDVCVSKKR